MSSDTKTSAQKRAQRKRRDAARAEALAAACALLDHVLAQREHFLRGGLSDLYRRTVPVELHERWSKARALLAWRAGPAKRGDKPGRRPLRRADRKVSR